MTMDTSFELERLTSLNGLADALNQAGLPVADLEGSGLLFFRFTEAGRTIGYGGLEGAAPDMLLRSITVAPDARNQGYGVRIMQAIEREAAALGADRLHLLTNTAARFFSRSGYVPAGRNAAPASVASCEQFRSLCPASAAYLVKRIGL